MYLSGNRIACTYGGCQSMYQALQVRRFGDSRPVSRVCPKGTHEYCISYDMWQSWGGLTACVCDRNTEMVESERKKARLKTFE